MLKKKKDEFIENLKSLEDRIVDSKITETSPDLPLITASQDKPDHIEPLANKLASSLGKHNADKRWEAHNQLMNAACTFAEDKWTEGDNKLHNEMTDWILKQKKYAVLKRYRRALMDKIKPIAEKFDKKIGVKGTKK